MNLGRNIMLVPIEWTKDGWFRVPPGFRVDQPIRKPKGGEAPPHGYILSDDFKGPDLDIKWGSPAQTAEGRYRFANGGLYLKGSGAARTGEASLYRKANPIRKPQKCVAE